MKRKKIIYVVTKSAWGGAQRYVFDLATNLPQNKFEAMVATGGDGPLVKKLHVAGVKTIIFPVLQKSNAFGNTLFSLANFTTFLTLINIYKKERPDIIHLNSSKIGGLGAVAAFVCKLLTLNFKYLNVIFTVHGWGFKEDRPWWQKTIIFFLSLLSSLFHDKIILINTADHHTAQRFIPKHKLVLIPNGIGPINFFSRIEAREFFSKKINRQIQDNEILIGTIAELTKNKGLPNLIDAVNQTNFQLIIIGDGELKNELENQINKLGLKNAIHLLGFLPEANRYLKAFDIFILPSLKEGLPYVLMEAMAAGLPLVATNVGGIPDLIRHGENGLLVPPQNTAGITQAIIDISKNEKLRSSFSETSLKIIKTKFNLNEMVQKTTSLYHSV